MAPKILIYFVILNVILCCCQGKIDVDKYLKTCDRTSPEVNECMLEAVVDGLQRLCDGVPELGVPPIDPYHQEEIKVDYKNNQIVAKMVMKNVYVYGMKNAKIHDARLKADEDRFHLEIDLTSPKIVVTGDYHGEGRFNAYKVNATGQFNTTMHDLVYTWKLDGKPEKRGDDTFVKITSFYMRPDVGELHTHASGIFPDNPELTELANSFANQNWRIMYREMLPYAQANWNKIGVRVANKIFLKIPYNELFPAKL
uniref:Putative odorant binding protein 9 n=1 Tax=Conopomorpha sinensis TaxID=940481 RepID=A0A649ZUK5_9NEOP|nr:putative odorant binding protein 9 [Conopomorpha sinensis]